MWKKLLKQTYIFDDLSNLALQEYIRFVIITMLGKVMVVNIKIISYHFTEINIILKFLCLNKFLSKILFVKKKKNLLETNITTLSWIVISLSLSLSLSLLLSRSPLWNWSSLSFALISVVAPIIVVVHSNLHRFSNLLHSISW